ncbi:hypothetical protein GY45DRAFT_1244956 [Cubamyces sp. BRFM 1775]|nr:hypothetical protein GY45DRAFT_1244956 [Cubamyces sp. BRFM 1775]
MHSVSAEASPGTCSPGEEDSTRRHRCPHCGKGFNRPSSLETHVNTHTGAKPHPCLFDGCPRRFNVKSNMRRHYQKHLRTRPMRSRQSSTPSASMTSASSRSPSPVSRNVHPPSAISTAHVSRDRVSFGCQP